MICKNPGGGTPPLISLRGGVMDCHPPLKPPMDMQVTQLNQFQLITMSLNKKVNRFQLIVMKLFKWKNVNSIKEFTKKYGTIN